MPPPPNPDEMLRTRGTQAFIASKVLFQTVQERFPEGPALTSHEYGWKRPDPEITPPSRCGRRNAFERDTADRSGIAISFRGPSYFNDQGTDGITPPPNHTTPRPGDRIPSTPQRRLWGIARLDRQPKVEYRIPPLLDDLPCYVALDDVRRCNRQIALLAARRECDLLRATAEREGLDIQTTLVRLLDSVGLPLECPLIAPPAELVAGFASADF
ncbi:hypothetical protein PAPYR_12189 [Paratrimastix pyriformis]|uniref:Uncharacterized protein n=1 Tax=Paratrimastix pyriformis TaxID=342808 RepID=A0ABQ8U691_9EUKA|nr:hypothetical protein PAPYR_12189 [Paratrimastix pyriformis]